MILTRLRIVRGGQVIDLRDTLPKETYRRETRLDEDIIDGTLTAVLQVPDLRVGDILDTALILRGTSAVVPRGKVGRLEFGEPVGPERLAMRWPKDMPIHASPLPAGSGVTYATRPGAPCEVIHEWQARNLVPFTIEDNAPQDVQGYGPTLEQPLLGVFDPAVAMARIDGQPVWMDATATHEGGNVATAPPPDYGYALPLSGLALTRLEPIVIDPQTYWRVEVVEGYDFRQAGVFFKVASVYRGEAANDRRRHCAVTQASIQRADYLRFYVDRYPGLQVLEPLVVIDDRAANEVTVREAYFLPAPARFKNGLHEDFPFGAEDFASNLPDVEIGTRKAPRYAGAASSHQHRVVVRGGSPITFDTPDRKHLINDGFEFRFDATSVGDGGMTMLWTYLRKGPVIAATKVADIIRDARAVAQDVGWTWSLVPCAPAKASAPESANTPVGDVGAGCPATGCRWGSRRAAGRSAPRRPKGEG